MQKHHLWLSIGVMLALGSTCLHAQEKALEKGRDYLVSQQQENGSWSQDEKLKLTDSTESFQALTRVQGGENALNKSLQFFSSLNEANNEYLSSKLFVLLNSTANIENLAAKLAALQKTDGGWGLADSKQGAIPQTLAAVNSLLTANKGYNTQISNGVEFLISAQQANGSWIFAGEHSLSDTAHTAMALLLLKKVQNENAFIGSGLEQAIMKAQQYLEGRNSSGSYGELLDTAWVYLAFAKIKQPSELQTSLNLITAAQTENGSWENKVYTTAICLQALSAIQAPAEEDLPDLEITEKNITFSPSAPLTGNEVTISATIFNNGELDAENVKIEFYERDPRLSGVELAPAQTIALIPAGGSIQVTAKFVSTGMVGAVQVVVFIDRENAIRETTKTNNAAAKIISIGGMPDLSVSTSDITLSNPNPKAFETVDLTVTIHNIGNETVRNIPVKIYDNDQFLHEFILEGVNASSSNKATLTTGFTAENHTIRVVVDPDHIITSEINTANNIASMTFSVEAEPEKPVDLAVLSIETDPAAPLSTDPTKITVKIANLGGQDVTTAFAVVLSVDGTAKGTINVPQLLKGQRAVLDFTGIMLAAGERVITAVADSANVITEDSNRANNTLSQTITVRDSSTPVDLEISGFTATPSTATAGSTVTFKVTLKNNGTTTAESVVVKLFNGTTPLGSGITLPRLVGGQSADLQFEHIFTTNGNYTIRAVADPDNKITESDKTNNEKSAIVAVAGATDLEITAGGIVLSADSVIAFQQFEITAIIKNIGNIDATNVPVRFIANGTTLATINLSGVAAGGSNKAILKTSLAKGAYNITISIDPDKTLGNEHNLINNIAYKTLAVTAPATSLADLAVTSLVIDPALPIANTPANLIATIANIGGTDIATAFSVEFKDNENVLHAFTVPGLAAGQKAELKLSANLAAGEHTILVTADSGNVITSEATKANNSAAKQLSVASNATPADLTVTVTMDKSSPNVMDKVTFTAAIYNGGTTIAENFHVKILVNGEAYGEEYLVASLPGGGTFNLQVPYTVVKEGANSIQITADSRNVVVENDKANNTGTLNFNAATIARPDLTIPNSGLATNPENPQISVPFEYKITVANTGNEASTTAKLIVTEGHPQMAGAVKLAEAAIPVIAAGAQATVSVNLKLTESKENIFIFIDSDDEVAESNEDNNLFKTSITLSALADLMVEKSQISFSHTELSKGKMVEIKAMVSNIGSIDAPASKGHFLDRRVGGTTYLIGEVDIPAIAAGGSAEVKILWSATGGAHTIIFEADIKNSLQEASKTNNRAEKDVNMLVPETTMRILKKNAESGEYLVNNQFTSYENAYFEVAHGYPNAKVVTVVEDTEEKLYRTAAQDGMQIFYTSYYAPGTYKVYVSVVDKETGVVVDELQGNFIITPQKILKSITASPNPKRATVEENVALKMIAEVVNGSNQEISGTLTFKLTAPSGAKAFEDKVHEVTIRPELTYFRFTHDPFEFAYAEVGNYTLTVELITELGTLTNSATVAVYETPPAPITPATLDMSLPLGEQILKKLEMMRNASSTNELYDVVFMFDTTGSFGGTISAFGEQSMSIMAAIKEQLGGSVHFGIASFADYPFHEWGDGYDYAYRIDHVLTSNTEAITDTFANTDWQYGGYDGPESQLEALYQLATGEGRDVNKNGSYDDHGDVKPSNIGWRKGSTRIVFFGTDVSFHRGGEPAYDWYFDEENVGTPWWGEPYYYPGPSWEKTVNTLIDNGITVVGLLPHAVTDVHDLLVEIGSVKRNGDPLIYNYSYSGAQIGSEVIEAVALSASALRFTARAVDDEMGFFKGMDPERVSAYPDEKSSFELKFEGIVEPGAVDQIFTFEIELVAAGGRVIGRIPISILVPQKTPLKVTTDKPQYIIGENTLVTVNLEMTPNAMKTISSADDLKKGTFDRANATVDPGNIILNIAGISTPKNQLKYGDFEEWEYWYHWKSTYSYNGYGYIEMMADVYDWEPISGTMSMTLYGQYDFWEEPMTSGDSTLYQEVVVPGDALSAKLTWKDRAYNRGNRYKVQIRDIENNVLRTLFVGDSETWDAKSHESDISEYLGKTIRVAFVFQPADYNNYDWMTVKIDDVSLGVTYPGYHTTGFASLIIDAETPVMWDKFSFEADTTAEGTSVAVRYRTAEGLSSLENAEFSAATDINEVKITSEACRYLEVQFILNTTDDLKTPKVKKLHATYVKYSGADNVKLKVAIEDSEGKQVKELADFLPQVMLGLRQEFKYDFDTTGHIPGDYKAMGRLYVNSKLESQGEAAFKLITDSIASQLESSIITDKLEYAGGDTMQITSRVKNNSTNSDLKDLAVKVEIKDAANTVIETFNYTITDLLQGSLNSKNLTYSIGSDLSVGPYTVTQTVTVAGLDPLVKTVSFTVKNNIDLGQGINGTLNPQPMTVKRRIGDLAFAITAQNSGNIDLSGVVFKVTIYDATFAAVKTLTSAAVNLPKSGTGFAGSLEYGKVELMPGTYPATLVAEFSVNDTMYSIPLDTTGFIVTNTAPVANAGADRALDATSLTSTEVTLSGSASTDENSTDAAKKNDIVKYEWKEGNTVLGEGETLKVNLPIGEHTITLVVTDTCGATSSAAVKISIKASGVPVISDLTPPNGAIVKELGVGATATDTVSGIDWTSLDFKAGTTVLTASYDESTGRITSSLPANSPDGWYDLSLKVKNNSGSGAETPAWRIGLDRTPPVISEMAPSNNSESENKAQTISAKISDAMSGVDASTIVLKIDGATVIHTWDEATGTVSFSAADLSETAHSISLTVKDKVTNESTSSWSFTVTTPAVPGITGKLTAAPETVKRRIGDLSLAVEAKNSGNVALTDVIFTVKIYNPAGDTVLKEFSGKDNLALEGTYTAAHPYGAKVDLMPGTYPVILTATYTFGGTAKTVTLDTKNIIVTNTAPAANAGADQDISATATSTEITLTGAASTDENSTDEAKKNDIVKYEWKNGETALGEGETLKVNLPLGEHTLTLIVTDTCGATGIDTVKITIADKMPPVISDLTPAHQSESEEKSPAISAKITDTLSGVDASTIVLKVDDTAVTHAWEEATGKVSFNASDLSEAAHNVSLTVKDKAGNEASATWSFTIKAPAVAGITGTLTPAPETVKRRIGDLSLAVEAKNSGNVALTDVTFTVKIYNPAGDTVLKEFSGKDNLALEGTYTAAHPYGAKVDLMPGTYPAILTATYTLSGTAKTITLDTKNIVVTNTAPAANAGADQDISATATSTEITLTGAASTDENSTDEAKKNDIVKYEWKNGETALGEGETLKVNLPLGEHTITLTVTDTCGATGTDTVKITVADKTAPVITDLTPANQSEITEKSPEISAKITDAVSGVDAATIVLKVDGTTVTHVWTESTGKVSFNASNLSEAVHNVSLTVKDKAGNEATASWSFTVKAASAGGGDFLIFSNSQNQGIQFSGTLIQVNGRAHTNNSFASWSNTTNIQTVTATGQITGSGNVTITNRTPNAPQEPIPVYDFEYYRTNANHVHPNGWQIGWNEVVPAGIHYVNGNVMIPQDLNADVTIVATGDIQFGANTLTLRSPDTANRMALFSRDGAIRIYGNSCTVYGIIYAPKGTIHMGSTTKNIFGGLIGNTVENYAGSLIVSKYQKP